MRLPRLRRPGRRSGLKGIIQSWTIPASGHPALTWTPGFPGSQLQVTVFERNDETVIFVDTPYTRDTPDRMTDLAVFVNSRLIHAERVFS
ncbi:hypothetical protein [Parafrankia discariae]|uniref:hypothetical protein n=1 Tax=Parafrankia discariae TaxID=365528 RepID=UPI000367185E|nr:hypothetical protein [Parafrankia discariae]